MIGKIKQKQIEGRIEGKSQLDRQFFDEMENNILESMSRGEVIPGIPLTETKKDRASKEVLQQSHVRTISSMHGVLLEELIANEKTSRKWTSNQEPKYQKALRKQAVGKPAFIQGRPPLPGFRNNSHNGGSHKKSERGRNIDANMAPVGMEKREELETTQQFDFDLAEEKNSPSSIHAKSYAKYDDKTDISSTVFTSHPRRNTEGTIHFQSTMTNPDVKATIKCVCGIFRAHIRQSTNDKRRAEKTKVQSTIEFDIFDDDSSCSSCGKSIEDPTLAEISEFYESIYQRSHMEHDTIIFSLIYVERLIKSTGGMLAPTQRNWRSLLFSCMVLASKVWDDLSMWNYDFANLTAHTAGLASFTLSRINELELALLKCLKFIVKVPASEYAKYYFLIRTMLLESGLVNEGVPLGKRYCYQKLNIWNFPDLDQCLSNEIRNRRSKSLDGNIWKDLFKNRNFVCPV